VFKKKKKKSDEELGSNTRKKGFTDGAKGEVEKLYGKRFFLPVIDVIPIQAKTGKRKKDNHSRERNTREEKKKTNAGA